MRRHIALRVAALIFTVFIAVAPAFSSPKSDSPGGTIERIIWKIKKIFMPVAAEDPTFPKP
jgi:hypothetical protein